MMQAQLRSPWEFSVSRLSLAAVASNAAQNHATINRTSYLSAIVDIVFSASGAPTGGTLTAKLQDSADGVAWADFAPYGNLITVSAAITAANAAGGLLSMPVHLGGARQFVRAVTIAAPTGGNAPVVTTSASIRLFGPDRLPAL